MKKILVMLLIATMMLSLPACDKASEEASSVASSEINSEVSFTSAAESEVESIVESTMESAVESKAEEVISSALESDATSVASSVASVVASEGISKQSSIGDVSHSSQSVESKTNVVSVSKVETQVASKTTSSKTSTSSMPSNSTYSSSSSKKTSSYNTSHAVSSATSSTISTTSKSSTTECSHVFGDWNFLEIPECTTDGERYRVCDKCGYEETEILPQIGHDYAEYSRWDATCTEDGYITMRCTRPSCDSKYKVPIKATGHQNTKEVVSQKADCCHEEITQTVCTKCSAVLSEKVTAPIQPDAHDITTTNMSKYMYCIHCMNCCGEIDYHYLYGTQEEHAAEMLGYINKLRVDNGMEPLTLDANLTAYAKVRAKEISTNFSHEGLHPDVAENICTTASTQIAFDMWNASPKHRLNMLNPLYTKCGIAYYDGTSYPYVYFSLILQ